MVSLNWLNREELLAHLVPLKQTSLDCDNNVYMTEEGVRTVTWTAAYAASPNRLLRLSIVS